MAQYPFKMNLQDVVISRLKKTGVQLDPIFHEPIIGKIYTEEILIRAQYLYLYEGNRPFTRTFYGERDDVKGRVTVSRRELIAKNLLTYDSINKLDTLNISKGDRIVKLGTEKVDYLIKGINPSGQLQIAGSIPVIFVIYFTEFTEKKNA